MRKLLYVLLISLACVAPVKRLDIAKLLPVEAVAVYMDGDAVVIQSDTENTGTGDTVEEALDNLRENTTQVIYLDTARYLLVAEGSADAASQLLPQLKKGIKVGPYNGGNVKEEAKYLDAHTESAKPNINN